MAISRTFGGQTLLKPGAYSVTNQDNTAGVNLGNNDTVFLIGESAEGLSGNNSGGARVFRASQVNALAAYYGSGEIVDAALAVSRPSLTPGIGGAGNIVVYKTNDSVRAEGEISVVGTNAVAAGATLRFVNESIFLDQTLTEGEEWDVGVDTAASYTLTFSSGDPSAYDATGSAATVTVTGSAGTAITYEFDLNGTLIVSGNTAINVTSLTTPFEIANALSTQLATDFTADTVRVVDNTTTATITFTQGTATAGRDVPTFVPTTAADAAQIDIANPTPYADGSENTAASLLAAIQDNSLLSGLISASLSGNDINIQELSPKAEASFEMSTSDIADLLIDQIGEIVAYSSELGNTTSASYVASLEDAFNFEANVIVPLWSDDEDLPFANFKMAEILSNLERHVRERSNVRVRKEAQAMAGLRKDDWRETFGQSSVGGTVSANDASVDDQRSELLQVAIQDVRVRGADGALAWKKPHIMACLMAGIRLGSDVGEPLTFKFVAANGVGHNIDPDTGLSLSIGASLFKPGFDFDEAIDEGITFTELASGGNRIVVDNTTYATDESFVFNRGSVVEAAQFVAKSSREVLEAIFVGQKVSNGAAESIKNILRNHLRALNEQEIITSSIDAPFGFVEETFTVTIDGNTAGVQVEIKPVQGLDFIFINFTLGNISQSA